MNTTRNGKIARLPKAVREELNHRLEDGGGGEALLKWLNAQPAVQALVAHAFGGRPISKQSLSEWRRGGYQDWLWRNQAWERAQKMAATPNPPVTDHLAGCVTARYLLAMHQLVRAKAGGAPDLKTLRTFLHDVVAVRRGDHHVARMQLEQERLEFDRQKASGRGGGGAGSSPLPEIMENKPMETGGGFAPPPEPPAAPGPAEPAPPAPASAPAADSPAIIQAQPDNQEAVNCATNPGCARPWAQPRENSNEPWHQRAPAHGTALPILHASFPQGCPSRLAGQRSRVSFAPETPRWQSGSDENTPPTPRWPQIKSFWKCGTEWRGSKPSFRQTGIDKTTATF